MKRTTLLLLVVVLVITGAAQCPGGGSAPTAVPEPTSIPHSEQVMKFLNEIQPYHDAELKVWYPLERATTLYDYVQASIAYIGTVEPILPLYEAVEVPTEAQTYRDHDLAMMRGLLEAVKTLRQGIAESKWSLADSALAYVKGNNPGRWALEKEREDLASWFGLCYNAGTWENKTSSECAAPVPTSTQTPGPTWVIQSTSTSTPGPETATPIRILPSPARISPSPTVRPTSSPTRTARPTAVPPTAIPAPPTPTTGGGDTIYIGSKNSDKFHYTWCASAKKIKPANAIYFYSRAAALAAGYSPCAVCKP